MGGGVSDLSGSTTKNILYAIFNSIFILKVFTEACSAFDKGFVIFKKFYFNTTNIITSFREKVYHTYVQDLKPRLMISLITKNSTYVYMTNDPQNSFFLYL